MADYPQTNSDMSFNTNMLSKSPNSRYVGNSSQLLILVCAILLIVLDWNYFRFGGVNIVKAYQTHMLTEILIRGIITNAVFWVVLLAIYLVRRPQNKEEFLSYSLVTAVSFFALSMVGITNGLSYSNISAFLHLLLIWFGARKIILSNNNNIVSANYTTIILIFLDFFLFNLIYSFFPKVPINIINGAFIPIVPLYILFNIEQSMLKTIGLFIVIGFYIFSVLDTYRANVDFQNKLNTAQLEGVKTKASSAWDNFKNFFTKSYNQSMTNIYGDYYTGQVEQNQGKPLGVFLEDMKGDTEFLVGDTIDIWAKLKVQSIRNDDETGNDKINITVKCSLKNGTKAILGEVTPRENFSVTSFEEEFLQCRFKGLNLTPGYYQVTFNATFNFDTQSYLKAYYMDKERKRTLIAGEVDILREYGITDSNPTAIYTGGPVKIGMETTSPLPVGVPDPTTENFTSYIGITIDKNWAEGSIKSINDLRITLPEGLIKGEGCDDFENLPANMIDKTYDSNLVMVSRYWLAKTKRESDNKKGITAPKSYKCSLKLRDRQALLGETPIALRYFKTIINYNYMISRTTSINIKSVSGT